jgi:oligopeptide transport system permease protein
MARLLLVALCLLLVFTVVQPFLPGQKDPNEIFNTYDKYGKPSPMKNKAPSAEYWFGTDNVGHDLWSRIWAGTRTSLLLAFIVASVNCVVGITVGILWGYVRKLDALLTEVYNIMDNIPRTIILILMSYILRAGMGTMIISMCIVGWLGMARFIRNQVVMIRDRDYNLASRCLGTPTGKIMIRNLLPYLVSVIMLQTALAIPGAIGSEVFLTYIGLGLPVEIPSLGNLVNEGRKVMLVEAQRYQLLFPMLMTSAITVSFYALGNAFADASDPRNHR